MSFLKSETFWRVVFWLIVAVALVLAFKYWYVIVPLAVIGVIVIERKRIYTLISGATGTTPPTPPAPPA